MALTPAERQAAAKARKQETTDRLEKTVDKLTSENQKLREENRLLVEKIHKIEIAALRAQLKKSS